MADKGRPGSIQIGPATGSEGTLFHITLIDEASGVHFAEAWLTPEAMGLALASREQPCTIQLRGLDLVGKRREHKTEQVFVPNSFNRATRVGADGDFDHSAAAPLLAPFEVDGWIGRQADIFNYHNRLPGKKGERQDGSLYRVSFVRYVGQGDYGPEGE